MTNTWLEIDPEKYDELHEIGMTRGEDDTSEFVSPYAIPDRFRAGYDEKSDRYVIEFKYMVREASEVERVSDSVFIRLGEHSGRILGLEFAAQARAHAVGGLQHKEAASNSLEAIREAIAAVLKGADASRLENYNITRAVLEDHGDEVREAFSSREGIGL